MKDLFAEIAECLKRNEGIVLATIVSSDGSSPLPTGAMMLVKSSAGEIEGSVGGGLLEALVIEEAKKYFVERRSPKIGTFDLNDDVSNEGMICGGSVDVLLEPITNDDSDCYQDLLNTRKKGSDCVLVRLIGTSGTDVRRFTVQSQHDAVPESILSRAGADTGTVTDAIRHAFGKDDIKRVKGAGCEIIIQPVRGLQDLVIVGGGHVSLHLSQIAAIAGFSTTVIDDREEFANADRFPSASRVLTAEYDKALSRIEVKPSTFIVIVTRGHQFDELVLEHAIRTPARYIGMIGSKRKVIACFKNLRGRGVAEDSLRRVHAPIGLDIGAITAQEIAVSIVGELIRVRRGFEGESTILSDQLKSWFDGHGESSIPGSRKSK